MLVHMLRTAAKVLLRRKVFTAISLFGVALTILVLTASAAMLDHSFGPHPPELESSRTLGVRFMRLKGDRAHRHGPPAYGLLEKTVRDLPGTEATSIASIFEPSVSYVKGQRVSLFRKRTDGGFWRVYSFRFLEGAPYGDEEDRAGQMVAVINESTKGKLLGDGPAVGRTIEVDARRYRVVGVVEDVSILRATVFADLFVPHGSEPNAAAQRASMIEGSYMASILARTEEDLPRIREAFQERLKGLSFPSSEFREAEGAAHTLFETLAMDLFGFPDATPLYFVLAGLALAFMALPAVNLVNLNASRILERASEIGVRKAFGASSRALVGQFVLENVVLCLVGGALGLALSFVALGAVSRSGVLPHATFSPNLRIFAASLAMTLVFGVLSGAWPAWRMSRLHPVEALRGRQS